MLEATFHLIFILSALFVVGLLALVGMLILLFTSPEPTRTSVKATDILAREGYTDPPRIRRRKDLTRV